MESVAEPSSAIIPLSTYLPDPLETVDANKPSIEPVLVCTDEDDNQGHDSDNHNQAQGSDNHNQAQGSDNHNQAQESGSQKQAQDPDSHADCTLSKPVLKENEEKPESVDIERISTSAKTTAENAIEDVVPLQDKNPLDISGAVPLQDKNPLDISGAVPLQDKNPLDISDAVPVQDKNPLDISDDIPLRYKTSLYIPEQSSGSEGLEESGSDLNLAQYLENSDSTGDEGLEETRTYKKKEINFDHIVSSLDLIAEGASVTYAAKKFRVPYYRLHTFLKDFYGDSSDEDEVEKKSSEIKKTLEVSTMVQDIRSSDIKLANVDTVEIDNKSLIMKAEGPVVTESSENTNVLKNAMINIPASIVKEFKTNAAVDGEIKIETIETVMTDPFATTNGTACDSDTSPKPINKSSDEMSLLTKLSSPQLAIENRSPQLAIENGCKETTSACEVLGSVANKDVTPTESNEIDVPLASLDKISDASSAPLIPLSPTTQTGENVPSLPTSQIAELTSVKSVDLQAEIEHDVKAKEQEPENKTLKRIRSSVDEEPESKKHKPESLIDTNGTAHIANGKVDLEKKISKVSPASLKLRKFKRKDLEMMVITLFKETLLYSHDLGKYKDLCEGLETSLDHHRKKSTQYFKELDDLRKITARLQEEHNARKDQVTMPIRIKRSVGVQAAPHIISRAHQTTQHNLKGVKLIGPSAAIAANLKNPAPPLAIPAVGPAVSGAQQPCAANGNRTYANVAASSAPNVSDASRRFYVRQPISTPSTVAVCNQANAAHNKQAMNGFNILANNKLKTGGPAAGRGSSDLIDLTDEGDAKTQPPKPVGRPAQPQLGYTHNPTTVPAPVAAPAPARPGMNGAAFQHPAPLPVTAVQQVVGGAKKLPPQPTLKLSHKDNSIVLSWSMTKTEEHEVIASYQLYAYQESAQKPTSALWKKVGSVKALELPMACTLTQFMPGHRYHFAVRAVDSKNRVGAFSDPRSIRLERSN